MAQSTKQFLALADSPCLSRDKPDNKGSHAMSKRVYFPATVPDTYAAVRELDGMIQRTGLEKSLIELVKTRASQINGCAFCLNMHTKVARDHGETEQRLYLLNAWRETSVFSERERAALAWTECLTQLPGGVAPDADYAALEALFTPAEIANLTALIGMINMWNRIAVGLNWPLPRNA
jgi:AhpD family alkylhydroperoxidase